MASKISMHYLLMKEVLCLCVNTDGIAMWFESQNRIAHMRWSPRRGAVNKAAIHRHCRCRQKEKTVHTGFHAIHHTVTPSLWFLFCSSLFLSFVHLCSYLPVSPSLFLGAFAFAVWVEGLSVAASQSCAVICHTTEGKKHVLLMLPSPLSFCVSLS